MVCVRKCEVFLRISKTSDPSKTHKPTRCLHRQTAALIYCSGQIYFNRERRAARPPDRTHRRIQRICWKSLVILSYVMYCSPECNNERSNNIGRHKHLVVCMSCKGFAEERPRANYISYAVTLKSGMYVCTGMYVYIHIHSKTYSVTESPELFLFVAVVVVFT